MRMMSRPLSLDISKRYIFSHVAALMYIKILTLVIICAYLVPAPLIALPWVTPWTDLGLAAALA